MKDWKKHVVVLAGATLFGFAASVYAEQAPGTGDSSSQGMTRGMMGRHGPESMGGGMGGGHGSTAPSTRGMGLGTMLEGLDLTDEQRTELQPLDDELFRKQWEITGKTIEAQRKLRRQSTVKPRDDNAIAEAHKILQALREQRALAESQTREKAESILTVEQREQLRSQQHECTGGQA
jgi:Spy/CpxP family protein refolding chaperone